MPDRIACRRRTPSRQLVRVPLAGQLPEGIVVSFVLLALALLLILAGVYPLFEQLASRPALVADLCECHLGILSECECSADFAKPVGHARILRAVSVD